ncbi:MAG: IS4 family transposase [Sandaracinaceae bacterium]|nr:IS4 family transposase [Sandaracinaceae bacterium]
MANKKVRPEALLAATASSTARRCAELEHVYVAVDGSSLVLTDRAKSKPLGSIGKRDFPTRGLKVVNAVAVAPNDKFEGVLDVKFWARGASKSKQSRYLRRRSRDTEMRHWSAAVKSVSKVLKAHAPKVRPWFVMDREADESALLRQLSKAGTWFTIRAAQDRVARWRKKPTKLFSAASAAKLMGRRVLHIPRTPQRAARAAKVTIRATSLRLMLPTYAARDERIALDVGVVEVREVGTVSNPIHWVLLTNRPVTTLAEADRVIDSYRARWRIEEFHRTWKSGGCDAQNIHLRSANGIRKWSILLAAVAARTEHIKRLARTQPAEPATCELTEIEIRTLIFAKRLIKNTVEEVPDGIPTMRTAVRWIADIGGWSGQYAKYEPGSTSISRGLDELSRYTKMFTALAENPELAAEFLKKR